MNGSSQSALKSLQDLANNRKFQNFVSQAYSRSVLRQLRANPRDWPSYTSTLDNDLHYIAYFLFWQGLILKDSETYKAKADNYIKEGAQILEFLYATAPKESVERVEQIFNSALGYYISGYYARAYVLMKDLESGNSLPQEFEVLKKLFLKDIRGLRPLISSVLFSQEYSDSALAFGLRDKTLTEPDVFERILRTTLNKALSYFIEFPKNGYEKLLRQAVFLLEQGIELASNLHYVDWWWLFFAIKYLFNEYERNSLWLNLVPLISDDSSGELIVPYIRNNLKKRIPLLELWRSQIEALPKINDPDRKSYVLKMPTSSGKTKIAELAILRTLLDDKESKCIYLAPYRALAVEIERELRESFRGLGIMVSEIYGGFDLSAVEKHLIEKSKVLIATPEKMDAFIRYNPELCKGVKLIIVDEGHLINFTKRGLKFEFFIHRILRRFESQNVRFLVVSAVLPNTKEFARWITGDEENIIESEWRPSRQLLGEFRWTGTKGEIYYSDFEHDCYVLNFIRQSELSEIKGRRWRTKYPKDLKEAVVEAAIKLSREGITMIFSAQKRSAFPIGRRILKAIEINKAIAETQGSEFKLNINEDKRCLLDEAIKLAEEMMGADAELVKFLEAGFVVHHGDIPHSLRLKIEELVREEVVSLIIATTTLAQGVNLPIRTVIVDSLQHGHDSYISPTDFWNICGRAGRGMKENEGQILFAVDLTKPAKVRRKREIIERIVQGYKTYRLQSALRELLRMVLIKWESSHGNINLPELCQKLAENNLTWLSENERDEIREWLDFLDSELLALTVEISDEDISPDLLQMIFQKSLLFLQLQTEENVQEWLRAATEILHARIRYIRNKVQTKSQRKKYYLLGFPFTDCEKVENHADSLLDVYLKAEDYNSWTPDDKNKYLADICRFLFNLGELKPKNETLNQCFEKILSLWLQGYNPNEISQDRTVRRYTNNPAKISAYIEDAFVYKAPWGLNALWVFLSDKAKENNKELPSITSNFSGLLKYGVYDPVASCLMAFGLESRKLALKLSESFDGNRNDSKEVSRWFNNLSEEDLYGLTCSEDEICLVSRAQDRFFFERTVRLDKDKYKFTIKIDTAKVTKAFEKGDRLILSISENSDGTFSLHTLEGILIGTFRSRKPLPSFLKQQELTDTYITDIKKINDTGLQLHIVAEAL